MNSGLNNSFFVIIIFKECIISNGGFIQKHKNTCTTHEN